MSKQPRKQLILNESTGDYTARGPVSAETIIATAKSILAARVNRPVALTNPKEVSNYLVTQFAELEHEVFGCLFLDQRHRLIEFETLFTGTVDGCAVHPREVVKAALRLNAAAVVLVHNHPSGVAEPSGAHQTLTARLKEALALVDIRVLDRDRGRCDNGQLRDAGTDLSASGQGRPLRALQSSCYGLRLIKNNELRKQPQLKERNVLPTWQQSCRRRLSAPLD